jgi:hypothetical protein
MIQPLKLTSKEQADLVEFLHTLTDKRLDNIHRPELP